VVFSKDPFEPMYLFVCEPFIHERKIVTYHAGDSKSRIENRRRPASLLGQFFIPLAASSTVVTVRREKGTGLHRVQLPPGNWFAPPGSNRSGSGSNEAVGVSMERVARRSQVANHASRALLPSTFGPKRKEILIHRSMHLSLETTKLLAATCIRHFGT
jgi:hypothetical protein